MTYNGTSFTCLNCQRMSLYGACYDDMPFLCSACTGETNLLPRGQIREMGNEVLDAIHRRKCSVDRCLDMIANYKKAVRVLIKEHRPIYDAYQDTLDEEAG